MTGHHIGNINYNRKFPPTNWSQDHPGKKKCGICGREVVNIKNHMLIHSGERPFACSLCPKRFRQQANLKKHIDVHTGERKFSCPICHQKFRQSSHVHTHMQVHDK